jgi:hypothetical protein
MSNPAEGPSSPLTITSLTDGQPYTVRARAWNGMLINPALGDVPDGSNRVWGPWSTLYGPVVAGATGVGVMQDGVPVASANPGAGIQAEGVAVQTLASPVNVQQDGTTIAQVT